MSENKNTQFASNYFCSRGIKSWVEDEQVYLQVYDINGDPYDIVISYSEVERKAELYKDENGYNKKQDTNKRKKILQQIKLQNKVKNDADVNIVTCGHCGSVVLHELSHTEIDCPYCDTIMDTCDCPDYLYSGMENNETP